jgi:hypothetical protein
MKSLIVAFEQVLFVIPNVAVSRMLASLVPAGMEAPAVTVVPAGMKVTWVAKLTFVLGRSTVIVVSVAEAVVRTSAQDGLPANARSANDAACALHMRALVVGTNTLSADAA